MPGSSKPSLILLHTKDDAGALDAYLHAYNRLLGVHLGGGYQEKGRRPWPGHAGRGALLDDVLHGHGGQGRIGGRWPQLQDVEHFQVVPQTGWPMWGLEDLEPRVMEDTTAFSCSARCT